MPNNTNSKRKNVYTRDEGKCYYCGKFCSIKHGTIDHKIPKAQDGSNDYNNLVWACPECNGVKGPLNVEQFRNKIFNILLGDMATKVSTALRITNQKIKVDSIVFYGERRNK